MRNRESSFLHCFSHSHSSYCESDLMFFAFTLYWPSDKNHVAKKEPARIFLTQTGFTGVITGYNTKLRPVWLYDFD